MKKLFFSAVALVAFSSVSMANTIANEETVNIKSQVSTRISDCEVIAGLAVSVAEEAYHFETGECFDSWVWNYIYLNALYNCEN